MTFDQAAIIALMAVLLLAFALDRFRVELVALSGLAAALGLGLVPPDRAFEGFASPAVVTVAEILLLVGAMLRSRLMDRLAARLAPHVRTERRILFAVCTIGAGVSAFMNNIGALALMLPVALSLCRTARARPGVVLMPLSFATLLGGTCSLIGTPANLIVSGVRADAMGTPFGFLATGTIGLPVALVGLLFLVAAGPRLLDGRGLPAETWTDARPRRFVTELTIRPDGRLVGQSLPAAEAAHDLRIHAHLRGGRHVFGRREAMRLEPGDLVLTEIGIDVAHGLQRDSAAELALDRTGSGEAWQEAVVMPQSTIVGSALSTVAAFVEAGVGVAGIATRNPRIEGRLADLRIGVGDVLYLHGPPDAVARTVEDTDCLLLSPSGIEQSRSSGFAALGAFVAAVALSAANLLPPELAFGGAVLALAVGGALDLRRAVADLNWPVLLMLAAMIPLGGAVAETGAADRIADGLAHLSGGGVIGASVAILVAAVLITPFVNNVSAAAALAPVAAALARAAGVSADPLLLLVAIGVSLDFLTPFGHHNNTLVMGVGSYRFGDFARLGLPLLVVTALAALLATVAWGGATD